LNTAVPVLEEQRVRTWFQASVSVEPRSIIQLSISVKVQLTI